MVGERERLFTGQTFSLLNYFHFFRETLLPRRRAPMIRLIRPTTPRRLVQSSHQVRQFRRPLQRRLCSSCAHGSRRVGAGLQHATPLPFAAQSHPLCVVQFIYVCKNVRNGGGKGVVVGAMARHVPERLRARRTPFSTALSR